MKLRRGSGVVAFIAAAAVLTSSLATSAAIPEPVPDVGAGAVATALAVPQGLPLDAVSVFQIGDLTPANRNLALLAAAAVHAPAAVGRSFTGLLTAVTRAGTPIQLSSGANWAFPMATTALPLYAIGAVMGRDMSAVLAGGQIVMGQTSATLRGAQVGDVLSLVGPLGSTIRFSIGRIVPDEQIGGTEILMTTPMADLLGQVAESRVLVYGQFDHDALNGALAAYGLLGNPSIGVAHSWDPPNPDSTLSLAQTKAALGEFDFYYKTLTASGWTSINPTWVAKFVPTKDPYAFGISARCNVVIKADLSAALDEVAATYPTLFNVRTGIDVANTNRYGGCSNNGEARLARNTTNISRHSWGQPIDMSTVANAQGGIPVMDCRIVRIFRKHNFAWGGNFLRPDGMHFEWVGTPRSSIEYPSRFCPNLPGGLIQSVQRLGGGTRTVGLGPLFANDGFGSE